MKAKDIAKTYGIDANKFSIWISSTDVAYTSGALGGIVVDDSENIGEIVEQFKRDQAEELARISKDEADTAARVAKEKADIELDAQQKKEALASMLITSGFSFEGYSITKYSGYISGDDVVQIDRGSEGWFSTVTDVGASLMDSLVHIRRNALMELKEAAYDLGCNAVIGVDFDYLTLDPETVNAGGGTLYMPYVFGVTANGNAVNIKKV